LAESTYGSLIPPPTLSPHKTATLDELNVFPVVDRPGDPNEFSFIVKTRYFSSITGSSITVSSITVFLYNRTFLYNGTTVIEENFLKPFPL